MKPETKQKIIKLSITVGIILAICLAIYLPLKLTGTIEKINSAEKMRDIILSGGAYSYFIYFAIQFLQVTFLPLPAFVTTVPGTWVFGPWIAFGISFLAIMAGTIFAFFLGRKIGKPIINWIVGEKDAKKWNEKLAQGKFVFFLMMLFPCFPDDILCLLVGATNMTFRFFLITNLISRPIGIACTCFLGSGYLIPFSGWGIPVWIVLIALMAVAFYISWKYQKQIENFVTNLGAKISRKKEPQLIAGESDKTEDVENSKQSENNNKTGDEALEQSNILNGKAETLAADNDNVVIEETNAESAEVLSDNKDDKNLEQKSEKQKPKSKRKKSGNNK